MGVGHAAAVAALLSQIMYSSDFLIAPRPVRLPALPAAQASPAALRFSSPRPLPDQEPRTLSPLPQDIFTNRSPRLSPR